MNLKKYIDQISLNWHVDMCENNVRTEVDLYKRVGICRNKKQSKKKEWWNLITA